MLIVTASISHLAWIILGLGKFKNQQQYVLNSTWTVHGIVITKSDVCVTA